MNAICFGVWSHVVEPCDPRRSKFLLVVLEKRLSRHNTKHGLRKPVFVLDNSEQRRRAFSTIPCLLFSSIGWIENSIANDNIFDQ